jgi:hypothetical protein
MDLPTELSKSKKQNSIYFHLINVVLIFVLIFIICLIKSNFDNQLHNHSFWDPLKTTERNQLKGAHEFLYSRKTLWNNRMHLDQWGGFHEVRWRGGFLKLPLSINLDMDSKSEFTLIFSHSGDQYFGIKLRGESFPNSSEKNSFFFTKQKSEQYHIHKLIPFQREQHKVKLFLTETSLVIKNKNNKRSYLLPEEFTGFSFNHLSLKGGIAPVSISSVVFGFDNMIRYRFSFLNELWGWTIAIGGILSGLYLSLLVIFKFKWKRFLITFASLCILFGGYEILDRLIFKGLLPLPAAQTKEIEENKQFQSYYWLRNGIVPVSFDAAIKTIILQYSNDDFSREKIESIINKLNNKKMDIILAKYNSYDDKSIGPDDLILKNLAEKFNLRYQNFNSVLSKNKNHGELWWDKRHLTDLGQKVLNLSLTNLEPL